MVRLYWLADPLQALNKILSPIPSTVRFMTSGCFSYPMSCHPDILNGTHGPLHIALSLEVKSCMLVWCTLSLQIPNKGREASAYLKYIVDHYEVRKHSSQPLLYVESIPAPFHFSAIQRSLIQQLLARRS